MAIAAAVVVIQMADSEYLRRVQLEWTRSLPDAGEPRVGMATHADERREGVAADSVGRSLPPADP